MKIANKYIFPALLMLLSLRSSAQDRIPLNRHFYEVAEPVLEAQVYTRLVNNSSSGETVIWVFDLENRMVSHTKIGVNSEENFNQEFTETFDSAGNLLSKNLMNLDNSKYYTEYFEQGVKKAQVIFRGDNSYEIWRLNPESAYTLDHDDFKPSTDPNLLNQFLAKNLRYPKSARNSGAQGTVIVAVLVSEHGEVKEVELANGVQIHRDLGKEALRVIQEFKGPYQPALDLNGTPTEAWLYIPIRFKLS